MVHHLLNHLDPYISNEGAFRVGNSRKLGGHEATSKFPIPPSKLENFGTFLGSYSPPPVPHAPRFHHFHY